MEVRGVESTYEVSKCRLAKCVRKTVMVSCAVSVASKTRRMFVQLEYLRALGDGLKPRGEGASPCVT